MTFPTVDSRPELIVSDVGLSPMRRGDLRIWMSSPSYGPHMRMLVTWRGRSSMLIGAANRHFKKAQRNDASIVEWHGKPACPCRCASAVAACECHRSPHGARSCRLHARSGASALSAGIKAPRCVRQCLNALRQPGGRLNRSQSRRRGTSSGLPDRP